MRLSTVAITKKIIYFIFCGLVFSGSMYSRTFQDRSLVDVIESPPTCEIITPDGGQYQFNQLHARQFDFIKKTDIPEIVKTWQVSCNVPTQLLVQFSDNRSDTSLIGNESYFGLGRVNNQGLLGNYQLILDQAKVDSQSAELGLIESSALSKNVQRISVLKNKRYGWLTNGQTLSSGRFFSVNIAVKPILNSLKETNGPIIEATELDGSVDIIFSFGI